jgi:hypothetical protein
VDEEHATLLRELALNEASTDNIDGPTLDLLGGDLKGLGDAGVLKLAARGGGRKAGEGKEAHLAVKTIVVELLLVNPALVLLVEVVVVLKVLLSEDIEQLRVDGVRVAKSLDAGNGAKVLEEVVSGGKESHLDGTEG